MFFFFFFKPETKFKRGDTDSRVQIWPLNATTVFLVLTQSSLFKQGPNYDVFCVFFCLFSFFSRGGTGYLITPGHFLFRRETLHRPSKPPLVKCHRGGGRVLWRWHGVAWRGIPRQPACSIIHPKKNEKNPFFRGKILLVAFLRSHFLLNRISVT